MRKIFTKQYARQEAVKYAKKWAFKRNPKYYNFDSVGGDCTSFVSQCIYAGSNVMNYSKNNGWYYNNGNDKSPSWSGVEFLYKFLVTNKGKGPVGKEIVIQDIEIGDIVQLSFDGIRYGHSLIVVKINGNKSLDNILIASHTDDSYERAVASYNFRKVRFIKIRGVN